MKKFVFCLISLLALITLIGCGGGPGSPDNSNPNSGGNSIPQGWYNTASLIADAIGGAASYYQALSVIQETETEIPPENLIRQQNLNSTATQLVWIGPDSDGWYTYTDSLSYGSTTASCLKKIRCLNGDTIEFKGETLMTQSYDSSSGTIYLFASKGNDGLWAGNYSIDVGSTNGAHDDTPASSSLDKIKVDFTGVNNTNACGTYDWWFEEVKDGVVTIPNFNNIHFSASLRQNSPPVHATGWFISVRNGTYFRYDVEGYQNIYTPIANDFK